MVAIISTPPLTAEVSEDGDEADASETRSLDVTAGLHRQRLDAALAQLVPEFSRSYVQQLIAGGAVTVNHALCTKCARRLQVGERLGIELRPTPHSQAFAPQPMDLRVVYEDEHLLVIDKPVGLVVHPAPGHGSGTLLNGLLARDGAAQQLPRAGIVHRLDKDTSGLMVVARTRAAMDLLVQAIARRDVSRQYLALAHRPWVGAPDRRIDACIGRDPRNRLRMAVVDPLRHAGKPSVTDVHLLQNTALGCWVRCTLQTGRTHQIRVHMASIGHPLVADTVYGGHAVTGLTRQALHAWRLGLQHPVTGQPLAFEVPVPADMAAALHAWGLS